MATIAVILVNVDDLDGHVGNVSDSEFDILTKEYIREEVSRGNYQDTRIRYAVSDKTTSVIIDAIVEDDIDETSFKKDTSYSVLLPDGNGQFYVDDLDGESIIEHTGI